MVTKIKVQKASKRFQDQRRARRREKLLGLFVELHNEFDELVPAIIAEITNLLSLADTVNRTKCEIILWETVPPNKKRIRQLTPNPFQSRVQLKLAVVIPTGFEPVLSRLRCGTS